MKVPGSDWLARLDRKLSEAPTFGAQGNNTNYSKDDLKGNGDTKDRTEGEEVRFTYSGQAGATDRGEADEDFQTTPVDQDPRMAGEDADARDYVSGYGNAEAAMDANRAFEQVISEDTDFWDLAQRTEDSGDRDDAEPPEGQQLLTEPSECEEADNGCNGWNVPWGEPPEGYRKVGVGESTAKHFVNSLLTEVNRSRK